MAVEINARVAQVPLTDVHCGRCGAAYAISERFRQECLERGTGWHCPYCQCSWGYFTNGENARLKRELELERKRKEWAEQEAANARARAQRAEHATRAQKGVTTKLRKRIANGVCPCCRRSFTNLARHIAGQHPGFVES